MGRGMTFAGPHAIPIVNLRHENNMKWYGLSVAACAKTNKKKKKKKKKKKRSNLSIISECISSFNLLREKKEEEEEEKKEGGGGGPWKQEAGDSYLRAGNVRAHGLHDTRRDKAT
jgi:hypothetical protein